MKTLRITEIAIGGRKAPAHIIAAIEPIPLDGAALDLHFLRMAFGGGDHEEIVVTWLEGDTRYEASHNP